MSAITIPPIERLLEIMAALRDPARGCPWDLEQDFQSIAPYTLEEAYEVADAIQRADYSALKEELGDLLLQVVFHAQLAKERQLFDFNAVTQTIAEKLIARHPHVFGEMRINSSAAQTQAWESYKQQEREAKAQTSAMDNIPLAFPALLRAIKLQKRAARTGFDWPEAAPVYDKIAEELAEVKTAEGDGSALEEEIGDLLFAVVNLARHYHVDAEKALHAANRKFEQRFRQMEALGGNQFADLPLEEKEALWQRVKQQ